MTTSESTPSASSLGAQARAYWQLGRPFTCLAPGLGVLSGTAAGIGAMAKREGVDAAVILERFGAPSHPSGESWVVAVLLGLLAAVGLNVYSNAINQVFDVEIDRIAKPDRPLVTGAVSRRGAITFALAALIAGLVWAMGARPPGSNSWEFLFCAAMAALLTTAYSVPPFRFKRHGVLANVVIAIARGMFLKVAGWVCLFPAFVPFDGEPWSLGLVFFLFTLGAVTTKDFGDAKADAACGVRSLPVMWGDKKAAQVSAVFLSLPWLLLPLLGWAEVLNAPLAALAVLGLALFTYGGWTGLQLIKNQASLGSERNHPSWKHMYLLMMTAQIGMGVVYLI